jgi:LysR family glycine cleavage system transcriptional activator
MPRRLPSLNALRTFEAAARLGRMTAAAAELCVTHGAVSRQVKALQDELGVALLEGDKHALRLTAAGRALLPALTQALTQALDQMAAAVQAISPSSQPVLNVSCLSTFAMRWLIPRLHRFHDRHPGVEVRLSTVSHAVQIERERYDVVIGVEDPRPPAAAATAPTAAQRADGPLVEALFDEHLGLVLSPALMARLMAAPPARRMARLQRCPRLQTQTRPDAWLDWGKACGARLPAAPEQVFAHYAYTLEAALGGLGLCIAPWHLVADDVNASRLIAPLGFVGSGLRYTAQSRAGQRQAHAARFCRWLQEEARRMAAAPR